MNTVRAYPLLLKPVVKDYIWGGTRLLTDYGYAADTAAAEAWTLSCHKDGASVVVNGPLAGQTLPDVLAGWGKSAIGGKAAAFPYFPILIKLIDAKDRLSVQVHPDDAYALRVEGEFGKTEMWYVLDCAPGAELIYGFKQPLDKEQLRRRIEDDTLLEVCNFVPVSKGDVFFIEAGTLHAIGEGLLIAEVQQNSNTTYRVSDYGRLGADGKPRPLHVDKAVEVTTLSPPTRPYGPVGAFCPRPGGRVRELADCALFRVSLWEVDGCMTVGEADSFVSLLCIDGQLTVTCDDTSLSMRKGESLFLPAAMTAQLSGQAQLLVSCV